MSQPVETELQLSVSESAILDSDGYAEIRLGPVAFGERWVISIMNTASDSTASPVHKVFRGPAGHGQRLDFTRSGKGDTSATNIQLRTGEYITGTWEEGTAGATVTLSLDGSQYLLGRRSY